MTIPELADRIEERLGELQEEIVRLQAANEALAPIRTIAAAAEPASDLHSPERALECSVFDRASRPRSPHQATARRVSKPAAVLALRRELDAGLRNRF